MIIKRCLATLGFIAAVAAVTPLADAATTTGTMVGSACQSVYDNTWSYGSLIYKNVNGVTNSDTQYGKFFVCPIQRVNGLSTTGLVGAWVDLHEASTNPSLQSWCQLGAYDEFGNQVAQNPIKYSGGSGNKELALGGLATSDSWGNYSIFCTLMPRPSGTVAGQLYAYEWQER